MFPMFQLVLVPLFLQQLCSPPMVSGFATLSPYNNRPTVLSWVTTLTTASSSSRRFLGANEIQDEEVARQLQRAREVLAKTKAKMEARAAAELVADDDDDDDLEGTETSKGSVPFFASQAATKTKREGDKKEKVIKSKNESGLFTTDGALMAELSESEEWEARPLLDVFQNENKKANTKDTLADRDVAASIFGLQRVLQTEDFMKIFDKRNRFIGDQ